MMHPIAAVTQERCARHGTGFQARRQVTGNRGVPTRAPRTIWIIKYYRSLAGAPFASNLLLWAGIQMGRRELRRIFYEPPYRTTRFASCRRAGRCRF